MAGREDTAPERRRPLQAEGGGNEMLQGIEIIFADRVTMLTSLKKKGYENFFRDFEREHEHFFVEMRSRRQTEKPWQKRLENA